MSATLVTELISGAQAAADMQDDFVTPPQWVRWANVGFKRLVVRVGRNGYPYQQTEVPVVLNGAATYSIAEPTALMAVYFVDTDGAYRKLEQINSIQKRQTGIQGSGNPRRFHVTPDNDSGTIVLSFYPNPTSGSVVALVIPSPATLTLASTVYFPLGWEEYIVLYMAKKALGKEETINPVIMQEWQECLDFIDESCTSYLNAGESTIRDIRDDNFHQINDPSRWIWYFV